MGYDGRYVGCMEVVNEPVRGGNCMGDVSL